MKVMFVIWGGIGLLANIVSFLSLFVSSSVGVGTSAYVSAIALIWIGGMVFFGLGSILFRTSDINLTSDAVQAEDNPYRPDSSQGKAWARGIADREKS
jgi:hypothetical protein